MEENSKNKKIGLIRDIIKNDINKLPIDLRKETFNYMYKLVRENCENKNIDTNKIILEKKNEKEIYLNIGILDLNDIIRIQEHINYFKNSNNSKNI